MKTIGISSILIVLIARVISFAQPVLSPLSDMTELRPMGERRLWTFITTDSVLGRLQSVVAEQTEIDGADGITIKSQLAIDLNKIGFLQKLDITENWTISNAGDFLATEITADISGQPIELKLGRDGEKIEASVIQNNQESKQSIAYPQGSFAVNSFFVDQLELFFASREMKVGNSFDEEIIVPLDLLPSKIVGEITEFSWQRLHSGFIDSVFVVQLTQPGKMELFFTRDRNLRKVNYPNQKIRVYLDLIQNAKTETASATRTSPGDSPLLLGKRLPSWLFYLFLGAISALFFVGRAYKKTIVYLAFISGALLLWVTTVTLLPLQAKIIEIFLIPAAQRGESLYLVAFLPALVVGLGQSLAGMLGLSGWARYKNINSIAPAIGASIGAGFGIAEAIFISLNIPVSALTFWSLFERGFFILFHAVSVGLFGWALVRTRKTILILVAGAGLVNSIFRYLPILVQNRLVTEEATYLVVASVTTLFLIAVLLLFKQQPPE